MKTLLSISIFLLSFQFSNAQALTQSEGEAIDRTEMDNTTKCVNELRTKVLTELVLPSSLKIGQTIVDVKIDKTGKIIEHNVVKSLGRDMDKSIANALSTVDRISPIIIDDLASEQVVRLPINIED